MYCKVEAVGPGAGLSKAWNGIVETDCRTQQLDVEDAMDCS